MANDKKNWKVIISVCDEGRFINHIYGVTYEEACASVQRQIEGDKKVLGFMVIEA